MDDRVRLLCGDCLALMRDIPDGIVSAIVTDPPYNEVNRESGGLRSFNKGGADSDSVPIASVAREFARIARGSIYVWCGIEQVSPWRKAFVGLGLTTRACTWIKTNPAPINGEHLWLSAIELCIFARKPRAIFNRDCAVPAWRGPSKRVNGFPCPKPLWLMRELVNASTAPGDTVLDPYMGSGSTGVACLKAGRRFIGIEISPTYFKVAQRRLAAAATPLFDGVRSTLERPHMSPSLAIDDLVDCRVMDAKTPGE